MNAKKYTADEQKQIDNFGHLLPKTGGSFSWDGEKLIPISPPSVNLAQQGFISQPTTITADESHSDANRAATAAAAMRAAHPNV